ncbi:histidine biosynthesis protein [Flavobacteria bacterium MS024-3C]|jgi:phosphoribosylformimino-5-aminoimidazole carboxamide ribotide isomerase|nr:histidine biosynthesis protein [Flavobacteria bacterium MS024-3C]KRO79517.1 MAG: 1-(5-phosphoribosyl)-5-[(5-phosphoribosylamino)methylideneamino] imidazole-4-carboxamide isomerase [Polaribacter sp. BACL8 MAG-120531-bin13]KRO98123.1 MAG: 1-(5-phosphoribosyl)-5-[(5-phosphoribosylamino)methylideneamino] imidazole-4-carboxamide isomerase [Polaribacter sp. BACL8 MAG-120619-bin41]MBT4839560.1 1-(5-phosphoribosyl)-5-[(5-phosphoribosylamino)methylideneamino]imidazole-4-carboxamide isomerase [Flavobac|tara:strand:- start:179 stop:913 length:735 start_codon:yes stop_codon:yes gene_type:complete
MRIIPAIDIIDGQCVRLSKGDYSTAKIYSNDPLEMAKAFQDHGVEYLHLVDLDGAKSHGIVNHKVLEKIATKTNLKIDFGGGLKTDQDLKIAFESGAKQITGGSIAIKDPATFLSWIETYGAHRIILGADAANEKIAISGWLETSSEDLIPYVSNFMARGITDVICTDISKDGMLAGPSIALYEKMISRLNGIKLIASGGVAELQDLHDLKAVGCDAAIVGKAIYEYRISLKEIEQFILNTSSC